MDGRLRELEMDRRLQAEVDPGARVLPALVELAMDHPDREIRIEASRRARRRLLEIERSLSRR